MTRAQDPQVDGTKHSFYQRHLLAEALCGHSLWRDIQHAAGELPGPIVFKDELRALRSKLGKSHEDAWIERLNALGVQVVGIGETGSDEERERRTLDAIKSNAEAIHGGRISYEPRQDRLKEHLTSWLEHQGVLDKEQSSSDYWKRGAKITRHHGFSFAVEYEPTDDEGYLFDGRLTADDAKLLEQIVIPTALRTLGFAAYAGVTEKFVLEKKKKGKARTY